MGRGANISDSKNGPTHVEGMGRGWDKACRGEGRGGRGGREGLFGIVCSCLSVPYWLCLYLQELVCASASPVHTHVGTCHLHSH